MKSISIFLTVNFLFLSSIFAHDQREADKSSYVLSFGKVLTGTVEVNLESNDVIIRDGLDITHLPASKVQKISSTDDKTGVELIYYSGVFGLNNDPFLFETLSDGEIPLLYREGLKFSKYDEEFYSPFFVLINDQIFALSSSKKEILSIFAPEAAEAMKEFMKEHKTDLSSAEDLKMLFDHYNAERLLAAN